MIRREKITVNVTNNDELEFALKRKIKNPIEVELWSESKSGEHFLAICGASYAVFEKSPDDDLSNTPICKYVGSTSVRIENEECYADDIVWCEHGGCARILFHGTLEYGFKTSVEVVYDEQSYELSERKFRTQNDNPQFLKRKKLVRSYLGKTVKIFMDRPIGYIHEKENYTLTYPINYGFIPGIIGGDGEELDVYLLGVDKPVSKYTAKIIGIVHRENDAEDKLVAAPEGVTFTKEEIRKQVVFQEKYYDSFIETEESFFECSVKQCLPDRKIPAELEHYLLNKLLYPCENDIYRFPSWKEFNNLDDFNLYKDKPDKYRDTVTHYPDFICSPRTLFLALRRRYLRMNNNLSDNVKINLRFYFIKGNLMMKVDSLEE